MSGLLEVICGPVGSGKSAELGRRLSLLRAAGMPFLVFRPDFLRSRIEGTIKTGVDRKGVDFMLHVAEKFPESDTIAVDGANFYCSEIIDAVDGWTEKKRVICTGLDMDFAGKPFDTMALLMAIADDVLKLSAVCVSCRGRATRSQLVEMSKGMPREAAEYAAYYEPRCRECHEVPYNYKPENNLRWIMER